MTAIQPKPADSGGLPDGTRGGVQPRDAVSRSERPRKVSTRAQLEDALMHVRAMPEVRVGELLLADMAVTPEHLATGLRLQAKDHDKRIGQVLIELGVLDTDSLYRAISRKLGVPYVDVVHFDIDDSSLAELPQDLMVREHALPLCHVGGSLVVAVPDPLDGALHERMAFMVGKPVAIAIAPVHAIDETLAKRLGPVASSEDAAHIAESMALETEVEDNDSGQVRETDNSLVRLVNKMILDAVARNASDIHVESNPGRDNVLVRFRIDGDLGDYLSLPYRFRRALVSRLKIMADIDISERRRAQDGRITFRKFGPADVELRVVTVPTRDGLEDVVLRLLTAREPLPLAKLGLPDDVRSPLLGLIAKPHGLILAVGPTGSGKTTTLHSLIHEINTPEKKIWTAENPVEIVQAGLRQVQVNSKIGWTFANIMRSFLRADPDVIMVGEMRDAETADIAVEASLTGHLVFSTLHTNSAAETVVRLLDMGVDPFSFTDSLLGVLGQRLVRRLCESCREPHRLDATERQALASDYCHGTGLDPADALRRWETRHGPALTLWRTKGCDACRHTGYRGRIGIYELFVVTSEIRQMMIRHATAAELQGAAVLAGMRTLKQDGLDKCLAGVTDIHEVHATSV